MVRTIVAMRISFVGLVTCSPSSTGASGGGVEASMTSGWTGVPAAAPSGLGVVTRHSVGCGADQETVPGYGPGRIDPRSFGGADGRADGPPGASAGSARGPVLEDAAPIANSGGHPGSRPGWHTQQCPVSPLVTAWTTASAIWEGGINGKSTAAKGITANCVNPG